MNRELQAQLCSRFRPLKGGDASIGSGYASLKEDRQTVS
jgi:hypothetical protein